MGSRVPERTQPVVLAAGSVETCMRSVLLGAVFLLNAATVFAQTATVRVEVRSADGPVRDAEVVVNGVTQKTDAQGVTVFSVPPGTIEVVVVKNGFAPASASVDVLAGQQR